MRLLLVMLRLPLLVLHLVLLRLVRHFRIRLVRHFRIRLVRHFRLVLLQLSHRVRVMLMTLVPMTLFLHRRPRSAAAARAESPSVWWALERGQLPMRPLSL